MIDLILFLFAVACIYAGFKAGNKYATVGAAFGALKGWVKSFL